MDAVVRTGVPITVGHRWPLVDNESSGRFVKTFYEKLLADYSPEQALFWARRAVMQDDPTWASAVMVVQNF
jgi:CHAT domain-containing protein